MISTLRTWIWDEGLGCDLPPTSELGEEPQEYSLSDV